MTISQEVAVRTAITFAKKMGYRKYVFCGANLKEEVVADNELPFLSPSPLLWIVRFQKPNRIQGVCDDGNAIICVTVNANTGVPSLFKGI